MAITGKKRIELTKELIINKIGAFAIYNYYINGLIIGKPILSPFRKEKNPSFVVKESKNGYYHKDYGALEFHGSCIDFVSQKFSLSFFEAIKKIAKDFGLLQDGQIIEITREEPIKTEKKRIIPDIIQVKAYPFKEQHLEYLSDFHISPTSLEIFKDVKVVAIKEWALNRLKMPLKRKEVAFAFVHSSGIKIYRPNANKLEKWKSTIPYRQMFGLQNLENTEFGIITKGNKDGWVIGEHITKNVCCVQGEDLSAITPENIKWINQNCKNVYLNFDSDPPGKRSSLAITKLTGWKHINVPDQYQEEGIKDFAELCRKYGPEVLKAYFRTKIKEL